MMEFELDTGDGENKLSTSELSNFYGMQYNLQPIGITNDGLGAIFQDTEGNQKTVNFIDELNSHGVKIKNATPQNADYNNVNMKWRYAIENLEDPTAREAYLKAKAQKEWGVQNPVVMGSGTDYYLFAPQYNKWIAMTNKPGLDLTDVSTVANQGGRILGGVAGGAAGALAGGGVGSIAGGALGAGLGTGVADAALTGFAASNDEDFQNAFDMSKEWQGRAVGMGVGALGGAVGPALKTAALAGRGGGLVRALSGVENTGVVSPVAKTAGGVVEGVGAVGQWGAKTLNTSMGRAAIEMGLDPTGVTGVAQGVGFLGELPQMAVKGIGKLADKFSKAAPVTSGVRVPQPRIPRWDFPTPKAPTGLEAGFFPKSAAKTAGGFYGAGIPKPPVASVFTQRTPSMGAKLGVQNEMARFGEQRAADLLRQRGMAVTPESIAQTMPEIAEQTLRQSTVGANVLGNVSERLGQWGQKAVSEAATEEGWRAGLKGMAGRATQGFTGQGGEAVGRGFDAAAKAGRSLQNATTAIEKGVLSGAEAGFGALKQTGAAVNRAGTMIQPYEMLGWRQTGAQELRNRMRRNEIVNPYQVSEEQFTNL